MPNITGRGEVATWEISAELPDGLTFGWSPARDALLDGSIRGMPAEVLEMTNFTIWANNSAHSQSFDISLTVNEEVNSEGEEDDEGFSWIWCFPCLLILLLLLLVPLIFGRDQILLLLADGPEPENTTSNPEFVSGAGTREDPFVLQPITGIEPGESASSIEVITIDKMSDIRVDMVDLNELSNGNKFCMFEAEFGDVGTRIVNIGKDGEIVINMKFDDGLGTPTFEGGEYNGLLKLGRASVYIAWTVKVKKNLSKKKKYERDLKKKEEVSEKDDLEKADEATEAANAEAAEVAAKEKADAEAGEKSVAKKKVEQKPATKEVKKKQELKRVQERAKSIDFGILGVAKASDKDDLQVIKGIGPFIEEKLNALGIYTYLQVSKMTSKLETDVNQAIEFFPGRVKRDQWAVQAKELHENSK